MRSHTPWASILLCAVLLAAGGHARAEEKYPTKPITLIVPGPPGGGTDTLARQLAQVVEPILGVRLVVENKPGAGGAIGTTDVTQARPDGYTLGFIFNGVLTTLPNTRKVQYTENDYVPIAQIGYGSYVMCVAPSFPADTAKQFLDELRKNPGKYTYGDDGVGNTMQLAAERIFQKFGIKETAVPFGGAGETARNFLGGHIDIYGGSLPPILPQVAAGKAKCLLLSSAADNPSVPQASGLKALGVPELDTGLWWGMIGPKGLPAPIVATLYEAFRKGAETPQVKQALATIGAEPVVRDPAQMKTLIDHESADLGQVAKQIGLAK
ncbi:MAG: tripartite tricarboxylate transporter substrate binding protein [Acidisphaera sp.]|nr:tripartite tricarboxylate transporter substrate binding protein [Acidisphaera sp.]